LRLRPSLSPRNARPVAPWSPRGPHLRAGVSERRSRGLQARWKQGCRPAATDSSSLPLLPPSATPRRRILERSEETISATSIQLKKPDKSAGPLRRKASLLTSNTRSRLTHARRAPSLPADCCGQREEDRGSNGLRRATDGDTRHGESARRRRSLSEASPRSPADDDDLSARRAAASSGGSGMTARLGVQSLKQGSECSGRRKRRGPG